MEDEKFLTAIEMWQMEARFKDLEILKLQQANLIKDNNLLKAQKDILELKRELKDLDILKNQIKIDEAVKREESVKAKTKEFNNYIKEKYNIDGKWGFDPESGRIIEGG